MKTNISSWKLLTTGWLILLLTLTPLIYARGVTSPVHESQENYETSTFPATTSPTDEMEEQYQGTTPTDLDLNFDTVTEDIDGTGSFETTTSVTSSTSIVKTGRHFGSRSQSSSKSKLPIGESNVNFIQPALKPRPTSSLISFNPTNYNRILKRRKNETNVISSTLFRSRSTQDGGISTETTELPLPTTTPTPPSQIPILQRRKLLFGPRTSRPLINVTNDDVTTTNDPASAETEFPTTLHPRNRKIKIMPIRIPALPLKSVTVSVLTTAQSTQEMEASASWPHVSSQVPPPPKFDPNDNASSFMVDHDGVYRFKYSASLAFPPPSLSSRIYSEEFSLGRHSYGEREDNDEEVLLNEEEEETTTTLRVPPTVDSETTLSPTVEIEGSEVEQTNSPIHRDYFSHEEVQPLKEPPLLISSQEITHVTVTVTVTENINNSTTLEEQKNDNKENVENQNLINMFIIPTPVLPDSSVSIKSSVDEVKLNSNIAGHIFPAHVSTNSSDVTRQTENQIKVAENQELQISSSNPVLEKPNLNLTASNEFKSTFYSTNQNQFYSTSSYYFTSSTLFSFFVPEDEDHHHHHFHGQANHHEHQLHENHQHHHQPNGEAVMENKEHQIQPSSSTFSYWDTLGLKTPILNQSEISSSTLSHSSIRIAGETTVRVDDESWKSHSTEPTPTSEFDKPKKQTAAPLPVTPTPTQPPAIEEENKISEIENNDKEEIKHEIIERIPSVAAFIQILLDMPPIQFCPSIKSFKELIILIYKKNDKQVGMDQVILYSEPNCLSNQPANSKFTNWKSQNSSPATNNAHVATVDGKESDISGGGEKINKTRRAHIGEPGDSLVESYATPSYLFVYVYLNDKNGTYDQILTESFVNLWNLTKDQEGLFFNKIRKVEMIVSSEGIIGHAPSNENAGVIAAITVSSIAVICLLLLGVLMLVMRHRQTQSTFAKRCTPVTLDDYSLDNISVFNSFRRKQRNRASKRSYTNAGFDDPNAPTRILDAEGLTTAVKEVSIMYDEFSRIPNLNPTLDDIPNGAESKNRYANVIPMPDTRVLLTFQDDQPNSDYINANFVQGANGINKAYILTQGPLEETIVDFWRMIWEQQIRVIFMLTNFSEAGIPKCGEYYPRSETIDCSQLHGDFQVTLEKKDITEHCITSNLVVKDMGRSLRRDVVHLWYHSWPEKGVPENPKSTVDFLVKSRKYTKEQCPILFHCSPGTGRSGTLVACDIGLKELDIHQKVNIPLIVKQLRHDRAGAVQTKEQYRHIYDVLQHYATKCVSSTSKDI